MTEKSFEHVNNILLLQNKSFIFLLWAFGIYPVNWILVGVKAKNFIEKSEKIAIKLLFSWLKQDFMIYGGVIIS